MELQPRDLEILQTVGELGTADTDIIHDLHFPLDSTGRACQQRLKKLSDAGLLKRVRLIASDGKMTAGSLPMLYFLTPDGADIVCRETGVSPKRVTTGEPKPFTLRHRLDIVRARLAIDQAARLSEVTPPEWIMEQDVREDIKRTADRSPSDYLVLNNRYKVEGVTVAFRPDATLNKPRWADRLSVSGKEIDLEWSWDYKAMRIVMPLAMLAMALPYVMAYRRRWHHRNVTG